MVNTDQAKPLMAVAMKIAIARLKNNWKKLRVNCSPDADYVYVVDFTDKEVTIATNAEKCSKFAAHEKQADKIILNNGELATNEESKILSSPSSLEHLSNLFSLNEKIKANKSEDDPMPLTKEERAELVKEINESITANMANAIAEALKPVQAKALKNYRPIRESD